VKRVNNRWSRIIKWGNYRLPFIFLVTCYLQGKKIKMPRWISHEQWDDVCKKADDWHKNLKWE